MKADPVCFAAGEEVFPGLVAGWNALLGKVIEYPVVRCRNAAGVTSGADGGENLGLDYDEARGGGAYMVC